MNWSEILSLALTILGIVIAMVGYYFKIKEMLIKNANDIINKAEETGKPGSEKMDYVVNELYELVPTAYKPMFSKTMIQQIVQVIFDKIEDYAKKQVDKLK